MLAHYAEDDPGVAGNVHHLAGDGRRDGHRLLHLHVFACVGAGFDDFQAEIRKRANIHELYERMAADVAPVFEKFASVLIREGATAVRMQSRARDNVKPDLSVRGYVLVGNRPRTDYPHAHQFILRWLV